MKRAAVLLAAVACLAAALVSHRRAPQNPLLDSTVTPEHSTVSGHVLERVGAGSYVYLRLVDGTGAERWLVTLSGPNAQRDELTATLYARSERFHSARVDRDFSPLHFASVSPR
jgi:hypothetical protein